MGDFLGNPSDSGFLFILERDSQLPCADVSWISKYVPEKEILFRPNLLCFTKAELGRDMPFCIYAKALPLAAENASSVRLRDYDSVAEAGAVFVHLATHREPQWRGSHCCFRVLVFPVSQELTVRDMQFKIFELTGIPPLNQNLEVIPDVVGFVGPSINPEKLLEPQATMAELGFHNKDALHLKFPWNSEEQRPKRVFGSGAKRGAKLDW